MSDEMKKAKAEGWEDAKEAEETKAEASEEECTESREEKAESAETENAENENTETESDEEEAPGEAPSGEDEALMAKYTRLMADFQNYRRRSEKEKSDIYAYANEKLILGLLEVIDNFERALAAETADTKYAEGMEMICRQLLSVLEKAGLEEIKALGEGFDPNFHNAVMTEDNDQFESGSVTEVLQKGYSLNGKVIRPSMVKVNN